MILHYTEKTINLGNKSYTVIIPDGISGLVNRNFIMDGDRKALKSVLMSLILLLNRKNIIVYLSLWNNKVPKYYNEGLRYLEDIQTRKNNFDVVFIPHYLQLPIHEWKTMRTKLKRITGLKHTFKTDIGKEKTK